MKKFIFLFVLLFLSCFLYADKAPKYGDAEVAMGKQNVEEIAKQYKFVEDPYYADRVNRIGQELAKIVNENKIPAVYGSDVLTPFSYEFRVVDGNDINAFSVMGGFIYVYKGMIDFCDTDDELAGIMAHEVIHAAHHHLVHLIDEQTKFSNQALIGLLVGILAAKGNPEAIAGVATASNLYQIAMSNGYSQEAERDADRGAFYLISKTTYNPVGLLTPLERLSQKAELVDLGIYRSHPITKERVLNMRKLLAENNIPLNRNLVSGRIKSEIKDETRNNIKVKSLYMNKKYIISIPEGNDSNGTKEKLENTVFVINKCFSENVEIFDIKYDNESVFIKGKTVFQPAVEDASISGFDLKDCVKNCYTVIKSFALQRDINTII